MYFWTILLILTIISGVECGHDFVAFTFDAAINERLSTLDLQSEINAAGTEHPFVLLFVDEFTLSDFSTFVHAYSQIGDDLTVNSNNITEAMRAAKGYDAEVLRTEHIMLPANAALYYKDDSITKQAAIIYLLANSLADAEQKFTMLRPRLNTPYTVIIISSSSLDDQKYRSIQHTRTKRQAPEGQRCHLALDGLKLVMRDGHDPNVVCYKTKVKKMECNEKAATFIIDAIDPKYCPPEKTSWPTKGSKPESLTLSLRATKTSKTFWQVTNATIDEISGAPPDWKLSKGRLAGFESIYWAGSTFDGYKCGLTPPIHKKQPHGDDAAVSFEFQNLVMQPFGYDPKTFNNNLIDCVTLFTSGSLMGLLTGLIFLIVLLAAYSMLYQLKSTDRFDDPKAQPLQINTKFE